MAPVIPDRFRDGNRAQLMLVGGLALAVTIVVLALVLNSAIYTHNLASRSDSAASESLTFDEDTRRGVGGIMDSVNNDEAGATFSNLADNHYGPALGSWESSTRNLTGSNGRAVSVTRSSEREGIRIVDDDGSTFYPASGTPSSWTVATEVRVRQFKMEVSAADLQPTDLSSFAADTPFNITFDGATTHRVAIYQDDDSSTVNVTVDEVGGSTLGTCTVPRSEVVVDVTGAEVGTDECEPLGFLSEYDGPYDVEFHNGGNVVGTYELTVDRVGGSDLSDETGPFTNAVDSTNFDYHCGDDSSPKQTYYPASSSDYPRVSPAIYSAEIETEFVGSDTIVRGQHRVAPDEPGTDPAAPRVTEFTVNENGDGEFTIDWAVEDPNGNLDRVYITVDGTIVKDFPSVEGDSWSESDTTVSGSSGPDYTIEITVIDSDNHRRSTTRTHDDDGSVGGCPA